MWRFAESITGKAIWGLTGAGPCGRSLWIRSAVAAQVNQNDVGADLFDIPVADYDIRVAFKKAAEMKALRYDDLLDLAGTFIKFHIHHIADFLAVPDIDDLFFLET